MAGKFKSAGFTLSDSETFEHHGAAILLLIRDKVCRNWRDLCDVLRLEGSDRAFHSGHLGLKHTIEGLSEAGLLESRDRHFGPYRVTEAALGSRHALGLSLTQCANLPRFSGIGVRPFFGRPKRMARAPHVFVVMPFAPELRAVFTGPIRAAARAQKLSVERADDFFSDGAIIQDIWDAINNCFVVVADCTGRNANVFYELGLAHTIGKPVVLLTQDTTDVPFDIAHLRLIRYQPTPRGFKRLELALRKTLAQVQESAWVPSKRARHRSQNKGQSNGTTK